MRKALTALLMISWGLWLGGMVALLLFVIQLFAASRAVAFDAAPVLFRTFAIYQLVVGMIACASGTLLALHTRRTAHALMTLLMLAALGAAIFIRGWTFEMERLRLAGESGGPRFKTLHGRSSAAYATSTGLLLVAGVGWVLTPSPRETDRETARA